MEIYFHLQRSFCLTSTLLKIEFFMYSPIKKRKVKINRDPVPLMMDESLNHHLERGLNRFGHTIFIS